MTRRLLTLALLALAAPAWAQINMGAIQYTPPAPAVEPILNAAPAVATSGTSEEVLYTISIKAGTLAKDGDSVQITAWAKPVNNANAKLLRIRQTNASGAQLAYVACAVNGVLPCVADLRVTRNSATTYLTWPNQHSGSTYAAWPTIERTGQDFTAAIVLVVTGQTATAAADLVLERVLAYRTSSLSASNLSIETSGSNVRVTSAHQQWTYRQYPGPDGAGDWVMTDLKVKAANKTWLTAFEAGMNNTLAFRNGEFIGGSHLNMGTPTVVWSMDGVRFIPSAGPVHGNLLEMAQTVTGYVGGVPTLAATFRDDARGRDDHSQSPLRSPRSIDSHNRRIYRNV